VRLAATILTGATLAARALQAQGSPPAASPVPPAGSTLAGVYSEAQAGRGETVYKTNCLECHVPTDYQGDAFKSKFVGGTALDMWEQIRSTMPQNNPGSLTNEQYTDLVAYLFKLNALPTRNADMPANKDSLKAIKVEAKPEGLSTLLGSFMKTTRSKGAANPHGSSRIR
jgi:mono/diheme cytochrome c family protein